MNSVLLIGGPLDGAEAPLDDFRDGQYCAEIENRLVIYDFAGQYLPVPPALAEAIDSDFRTGRGEQFARHGG